MPALRRAAAGKPPGLAGGPDHDRGGRCGLSTRHGVVLACMLANAVCYVDRANMAVAAVAMRAEYGWDAPTEGASSQQLAVVLAASSSQSSAESGQCTLLFCTENELRSLHRALAAVVGPCCLRVLPSITTVWALQH